MNKNVAGKTATFFLASIFILLFSAFPARAYASGAEAKINVLSETPAVSPSGEWSAKVEIENPTSQPLSAGILEARSSKTPVPSLAAISSWATGHMNLAAPALLAQTSTSSIPPGGSAIAKLKGKAGALGGKWGPRPLEFFFAPSSGQGKVSFSLNSFVTVEGASSLPQVPLSLVFVNPGPSSASRQGAENLVKTGEGEVFSGSGAPFSDGSGAIVQMIEDWRSQQALKNASAIEQPAQVDPDSLMALESLAKLWEGKGSLPKILVSPSSLSAAQLEEGAKMGYGAALESGGEGESLSLPGGKVTLLSCDSLLSSLAKGKASSAWAVAEESASGREARFVADIAAIRGRRSPLIVQVANGSAQLLSYLKGAKWIRFYTLGQDLSYPWPKSAPYVSPAPAPAPYVSPLTDQAHAISNLSSNPASSKAWSEKVGAQAAYAELCSKSQNEEVARAGEEAVHFMSRALEGSVRISSSKDVTVLSESALVPVTVKNSLPFPIEAKVSSLASNSQITILPEKSAKVGAGMEGQIDFPVQIHSSLTSRLTFWMGQFYHPVTKISTQLTSHLTVTRLNVIILIIPAGLLTIFGCIRQVRRKKKNG